MARYALVIGISNYEEPFNVLDKAIIDATGVAKVLKQDKRGYERISVLTGNVTEADLSNALKTLLKKQAVRNEVLVYFTGHGFTVTTSSGREEGYLATSDCILRTKEGQITAQMGGFALNDLNQLIQDSNVSNLVMLLDACHSGFFLEEVLMRKSLLAFSSMDYSLITACRGFEQAFVEKREEHSVFTKALLTGLSQDKADETGRISFGELFTFISNELQGKQEVISLGGGRSIVVMDYQLQSKLGSTPVDPIKNEKTGEILCPYQGLQVFDREQKEFFFGRKRLVEAIKQKLDKIPFVPVIGASGSGKSSVIRAGLLPWLEEEGNWQILEPLRPGSKPLDELRQVFKPFFKGSSVRQLDSFLDNETKYSKGLVNIIEHLPNSERFLLVVDQFEEVFTLCGSEKERQRFIELITQVTEISACRLAVVTTMRADFLEPCLRYPMLYQQLDQDQTVFMPSLAGADLRDAITKPAERQGYLVEEDLVFKLLEDVGKELGFLPLLEFALTKLWEKRDQEKRLLTLEEYQNLGADQDKVPDEEHKKLDGLTGALNLHANRVYEYQDFEESSPSEERDEKEKEWIKQIFLRLVRTGQQEKDTRQRQPKMRLLDIAGYIPEEQELLNELLDGEQGLVKGRLLVAGKDKDGAEWVDLAHEALIEGWQQFAQWRRERRDLRRLRDRLEDALQVWVGEPSDHNLMMGGLLAEVRERWAELQPYLQSPEQDEEFFRFSDAYEKNQIAKLKLEKAGVSSLRQFESGREIEGLLAALKNGEELRKLAGDKPLNLYPSFTPIFALQQMLYKSSDCNHFREYNHLEHSGIVYNVSFSPNGKLIAAAAQEGLEGGIGLLWDYSGKLVSKLNGHEKHIRSVRFSPLEQLIATASDDGTAKLWNYSGELVGELHGHEQSVRSVSFSPLEQLIATASDDGTAKLWNYSGELVRELHGHEQSVRSVSFSPLEQLIATASDDGTAKLWNYSGKLVGELRGHQTGVNTISFCRDEKLIITASQDGIARVCNYSGELLKELPGHRGELTDASFSPDGQLIATASKDGTIRLWNRSWQILQELRGHVEAPYCVSFSPDGQLLAAGWEIRARLWKRSTNLIQQLPHPPQDVIRTRFSPQGELIAIALRNGIVKLRNRCGDWAQYLSGHGWVSDIGFSRDGQRIAIVSQNGLVKLWTVTGELLQEFYASGAPIWGADLSSDGNLIATASNDGKVRLWNQSGEIIQELSESSSALCSVKFSPNGQGIAALSWFGRVQYWQISGQLIKAFSAHKVRCVEINFSSDGKLIATASEDGIAKLWNLSGDLVQELRGHQGWVVRISFSPTEDLVATASSDRRVRLWSYSGELVQEFHAYTEWPNSVSFSSDGKTVAAASENSPASLWNIYNLNELLNLGYDWLKDYFNTNSGTAI